MWQSVYAKMEILHHAVFHKMKIVLFSNLLQPVPLKLVGTMIVESEGMHVDLVHPTTELFIVVDSRIVLFALLTVHWSSFNCSYNIYCDIA